MTDNCLSNSVEKMLEDGLPRTFNMISSGDIIGDSLGDPLGDFIVDLNAFNAFSLVTALRCAKPIASDLIME